MILPYHLAEERLTEESASTADHLGTTRRGIGPCYRDKVGRVHGVRVGDLYHPADFRERLDRIVAYKNRLLAAMLPDFEPFDARDRRRRISRLRRAAAAVRPRHDDLAARGPGAGQAAAVRGAQGSLLDVDHGSYPYVTSSNSSAAGIAAGSGVPTRHIDRWIGVVKAYTTRVGGGPFPTEQDNETGERIRQVGREYGTVTGRPRRCGWFDAVAVRYSARVSGSTEIADHAAGRPQRPRRAEGRRRLRGRTAGGSPSCPASLADFELCRPVYETLPGWSEDLTGVRPMVRPAPRTPGTTSSSSPSRSASRPRSCRSARTAGRRSWSPRESGRERHARRDDRPAGPAWFS